MSVKGADEITAEDDQDEELVLTEQEQISVVKDLFSQLDPAIVQAQGEASGEVSVALRYIQEKELLLVRVVSAAGLGTRQVGKTFLNPCVEVLLLDDEDTDSACTSTKKSSLIPVWNVILMFKVEEYAVEGLRVLLKVKDGRDVLGEVVINVDWELLDGEIMWFRIEDERDWKLSGSVHVRLTYTTPSTLHVNVVSGEGLCGKNSNKLSNPFARVTLAGKYPVHSSKVIKDTVNPTWSETFNFALPVQLLQTTTVLIALYNKNLLTKDTFLGEVRVSLSEFKHFHHIDDWFPLADLKHVARHRTEWSKGAVEQEFREALVAHIACRRPETLFNSKAGAKSRVITLSCKKTGQKSKVNIVNGRPVLKNEVIES